MILAVDVGTTSLRAALVDDDGRIDAIHPRPFPPLTPTPGLVEVDAGAMATTVLDACRAALADAASRHEPVTAVGIAAQRATTIVWDRATGAPVGNGLGWQDLRTVGECLVAKAEHGLALAPNQTATKLAWLLANAPDAGDRATAGSRLCAGTVDTWVAWVLSEGALHVTDHTNAAVTGLYDAQAGTWSERVCGLLGIPIEFLPTIVDSAGPVGDAGALEGAPPLTGIVGDQQASLVGQGCVHAGAAKVTFGTGGMLDTCVDDVAPPGTARHHAGTFPIVAWSHAGRRTWGVEAIMLSAGTNVEWLCDDLGLIDAPEHSHAVAAECAGSDGVVFVPALLGLGTPHWDYGARGSLFGVTRGSTRAHVVRAVLEGVAHRGADLVEAAERDTGTTLTSLRVDGGMSTNPTFVQAFADATGRAVEVSPEVDATTLGAAHLAALGSGALASVDEIAGRWRPSRVVEPGAPVDRDAWQRAVARTRGWIPELSALDF